MSLSAKGYREGGGGRGVINILYVCVADDTDLSESEAISAAQITSPASAPSETEEESRDGTYCTL